MNPEINPTIAVYPISGDPPTLGHADILVRAAAVFSHVYWAIGHNHRKQSFFTLEQRLKMMGEYVAEMGLANVTVESFSGASIRYAETRGAGVLLRGLRNSTDFQFEMELATGNRSINPQIETLAFFTRPQYSAISSGIVRELILLGEDTSTYVLPKVADMIRSMLKTSS